MPGTERSIPENHTQTYILLVVGRIQYIFRKEAAIGSLSDETIVGLTRRAYIVKETTTDQPNPVFYAGRHTQGTTPRPTVGQVALFVPLLQTKFAAEAEASVHLHFLRNFTNNSCSFQWLWGGMLVLDGST